MNAGPARRPHLGCRLLQGRPPKDLPSTRPPSSPPHLTAFPSPSTAVLPGARPPLTRLLFPSSSISPTHRSCQVSLQTVFTRGLKSQIVLVCRFVSSGSPLDAQP